MSKQNQPKTKTVFIIQMIAIILLVALLMYGLGKSSKGTTGESIGIVSALEIIPTGVPSIYGDELQISYDDVGVADPRLADQTISVLSNIDRSETLEGQELDRYINILYELEGGISCEYCCGAGSVIFSDGKAACGCAHSYAMRGLTKFLIKFHGDEYTNEEILEEVGKWKVLFFPGIHEQKAKVLESEGIDSTNYINLASNKYRGIEKGQSSGGGMVGGC